MTGNPNFFRISWIVAFASISLQSFAAKADGKLDQLIESSGAALRLQHYSTGAENEFERLPAADLASKRQQRDAFGSAFDAEKLSAALRQRLASQALADGDIDAALQFFDSPLARRVAFGDIVATREMQIAASAVSLTTLPAERRRLLADTDRQLDASRASLQLVLTINRSIARGILIAQGHANVRDVDTERFVEGFRGHLTEFAYKSIELAIAHAARDLSIEELERLNQNLANPSVRTINRALTTALTEALADAGHVFGEGLGGAR